MKVLHLIDSGGLYGAEKMVLTLARAQRAAGVDAVIGSVVSMRSQEKMIEVAARAQQVPVIQLETGTGFSPWAIMQLRRQIGELRVDLIHSHGYKPDVLLAASTRRSRPAPVVATLHGWTSSQGISRNALYEWLDRRALARLDFVVGVSEQIRRWRAVASLQDFLIIPNGIEQVHESPSDEDLCELRKFCARAPTLLMLGRLSPEKDQGAAIRVLSRVHASGIAAQLLLIGEGALRPALEDLVGKLGLEDCVCMPGYVSDGWRILKYVDAMILTSLTEGMPVCVLEAMRQRVPVISTSVGDVPVMLRFGEAGWLVPPADESAVVHAVVECLTDLHLRATKVERASTVLSSQYTAEGMMHRYQAVYARVLSRWRGAEICR